MTFNQNQITKLYVGYFDRAADSGGLNFWVSQLDAGASLVDVAYSFSLSQEYQDIYGGLSDSQLVDAIYLNLFNRAPDPEGQAYWLNELANGKPHARLLVDIMSGAQGNDKLILENTAIVAQDWTSSTAHIPFDMAAAQNAISSIGEVQGDGVTIQFAEALLPYQAVLTNAMTAAWAQWGNHGRLDVRLDFLDQNSNTLAFAHARNEFFTGQTNASDVPITQSNVGVEVNTGMDMNGDLPDIVITVAMNMAQFLQYDTTSVLAHEIGHGLGFRTELFDFDQDSSTITSWDQFLTFQNGTQQPGYFNGPEAMLVYGGPVPITGYYNSTHPDGIGSIMDPTFGQGEVRMVGVLDKAMMNDIGVLV